MADDKPDNNPRLWRLAIIEERRAQADGFTWAVPGLAIAGQAFLLSIVLSSDVTNSARVVAALAGAGAAVGATHLYGKQLYLFDLYEGFIEAERRDLNLPGPQLDDLTPIADLQKNTLYYKRRWADESLLRLPGGTIPGLIPCSLR